jgi:hypothetical protein
MPADSPHFADSARSWSVNFRVADLDAMVGQLRAAGIEVSVDPETYPNGRFADLHDPEGNPVQLWEPAPGVLRFGGQPHHGSRRRGFARDADSTYASASPALSR